MGNDGGSIPSRGELVKTKSAPKKVQETATANNDFAWKYCVLSRAPLAQPFVSDAFGRLYNKESVIQYILDNTAYGDAVKDMSHITSMKDVVELHVATSDGKNICEVTRRDMNGQTKFVYISSCGHTFAAEALKNIGSSECLICSNPCTADDIIPLNPNETDLVRLCDRLAKLEESGLTHSGAAVKKRKKKRRALEAPDPVSLKVARTNSVSNEARAGPAQSSVLQSLFHKNDGKIVNDGFMTRGTSSRVG